jgi:hypothetical protein
MNFVARNLATLCFAVISITAHSADYASIDIDTGGLEGSTTTVGEDSLDITGAGADIWDNSDHFRFVCQSYNGDFQLRCRVADLQVTDAWSKAGVMIRASTDANSVHASMFVSGQNGFAFQHRDATGGGSAHSFGGPNLLPNSWVKIVKVGSVVTGFRSEDGVVWYSVASTNWYSVDPVLIGFAVTSHNPSLLCSAQICDISLQAPQGPVNGFTSVDVNTGPEGSTEAEGVDGFNVAGSGSDIWSNWDGFRLVYKSYSGDFDLRARVSSIENTDGWAKAGVTLRESASPDSIHVSMLATSSNGFAFQFRDQTGGSSTHIGGGAISSPNRWVRLIRSGNVVSAFKSVDNVLWEKVAATTWNGPDSVLVGMAVTAHNNSTLCDAEFRDVSLQPYTAPQIGAGDGLLVSYFNTTELTGLVALTRVEPAINNDWSAAPASEVNINNFSARWVGQVQPQFSESFTFYTVSDDGIRLWLNGQLLINNWTFHGPTWDSGTVTLSAGQKYDIMVEYFQGSGGAVAKLLWSSHSTPLDVVPQSQLYSTGNTIIGTGTGLLAQYYNSNDLSSPMAPFNVPVLTRVDGPIGFDWEGGSPAAEVNSDNFSARWIGEVQAQYTESTTLYVTADDGVRLWVGNNLLIDQWKDQPPTTYTATIDMTAGEKVGVKIEYYERHGGAAAKLEWSSASRPRAVVPTSQLYYQSGLYAPIPTYSVTSPAFIEGMAWSPNGAPIFVSANLNDSTFINENNWFINVPLNNDGSATTISVTQPGTGVSQSGAISWWPLDISGIEGSNENIVIRRGDSLLLTATGAGAALTIDTDGDGIANFTGLAGEKFAYQYNLAGTFLAQARIDGVEVGTLLVTVMNVDLHMPIACKVGFMRNKNVVIAPSAAASIIHFSAGDPTQLLMQNRGFFSNEDGQGTSLGLQTLHRGKPLLAARIGGPTGPIISTREVDEFTIDVPSLLSTGVDENGIGNTTLTIRPYIPNNRFSFEMFAHTSTFTGGVSSFSINTSDLDGTGNTIFEQVLDESTGDIIGRFTFQIEVPANETMYCFQLKGHQSASREEDDTEPIYCNGNVIKVEITPTPIYVAVGSTVTLTAVGSPDGGTYSWAPEVGMTTNGAVATISNTIPGTYTPRVTYTKDGASATAVATVMFIGVDHINYNGVSVTNVFIAGSGQVVLEAIPAPDGDWHGLEPSWDVGGVAAPSGPTATLNLIAEIQLQAMATLGTSNATCTAYPCVAQWDAHDDSKDPITWTVEPSLLSQFIVTKQLKIIEAGKPDRFIDPGYPEVPLLLSTMGLTGDATLVITVEFPSPDAPTVSGSVNVKWPLPPP